MRPIPFTLVAPATILLFGAVVTWTSTLLGLRELSSQAREAAGLHSRALADGLSARISEAPPELTQKIIEQAVHSCACTLLIIHDQGTVLSAAPQQPLSQASLSLLKSTSGKVLITEQVHYYAAASLPGRNAHLFAFSKVPKTKLQRNALLSSMFAFSALLLAAAGFVGWALARDVHLDVLYVRDVIISMADGRSSKRATAIAVRTIDQVGELTSSFNTLLERFQAAERAYRQDLHEAKNFAQDRAAFLAALSHELRTPLNAILGFADVLLDEIDGPMSEESRENLTIVRTSGEHLRSLIDDILALSALESGEFQLSREHVNLAELASEVVTEARVTAAQKNLWIRLTATSNDSATTAYADRRRMRQVFGNVISNAIKFTSTGGVEVHVAKDGDFVVTTVTDTGPGIAEEQLEAIFEEFRQADSSNAQRVGTGLGLSITRRLVQMHDGSVRADSKIGQGSTLTIRVPVEETERNQNSPRLPPAGVVPYAGQTVIHES